jgi:hypothetical protein
MEHPDRTGRAGTPGQGTFLIVHLRLDGPTVAAARFQTFGCGASIAAGSMLTEMVARRTVAQCLALTADDLADALGGFPPTSGTAPSWPSPPSTTPRRPTPNPGEADAAMTQRPGHDEPLPRRYHRACRLAARGRHDVARRLYERVAAAAPCNPGLRALVANDLAALAALDGDTAVATLRAALGLDPGCEPARLNLELLEPGSDGPRPEPRPAHPRPLSRARGEGRKTGPPPTSSRPSGPRSSACSSTGPPPAAPSTPSSGPSLWSIPPGDGPGWADRARAATRPDAPGTPFKAKPPGHSWCRQRPAPACPAPSWHTRTRKTAVQRRKPRPRRVSLSAADSQLLPMSPKKVPWGQFFSLTGAAATLAWSKTRGAYFISAHNRASIHL